MKLHSAVYVALFMVFCSVSASAQSGNTLLAFSDFLTDVNRGQVTDVTIEGNNITGLFTDGRAFTTYSPNDPGLVNRLIEKGVRVTDAAAARAAARAACEARFGIQQWVEDIDLTANPFRFKGQIVGVRTLFQKMVSADEAMFRSSGRFDGADILIVSGTPPLAFTQSGQRAVLAIKPEGMKKLDGTNIPDLRVVAVVDCP